MNCSNPTGTASGRPSRSTQTKTNSAVASRTSPSTRRAVCRSVKLVVSEMQQRLSEADDVAREGRRVVFDFCLTHRGPCSCTSEEIHAGAASHHFPARSFERAQERGLVEVAEGIAFIGVDRQINVWWGHRNSAVVRARRSRGVSSGAIAGRDLRVKGIPEAGSVVGTSQGVEGRDGLGAVCLLHGEIVARKALRRRPSGGGGRTVSGAQKPGQHPQSGVTSPHVEAAVLQ